MEEIATDIRNGLDGKSFDGSLKFDCGSEGVIILDNGKVTTEDKPPIVHCA